MRALTILSLLLTCSQQFFAQTGPFNWNAEQQVAPASFQNLRPRLTPNAAGDPVVLWGSNGTGANYAAVGGSSGFSAPVQVTAPGMGLWVADWIGSEIASDGNDVWVTGFGMNAGQWSVYGIGSSDGGYTWGDTLRASPLDAKPALYPTVEVGPTGPIIMYMEHNANFSQPRYVSVTSPNGGTSFNPPVQFSSLYAPGEVCDCCPAHLKSDGNDLFTMFRNNDNNQRDLYVAWSNDNGASFQGAADVEPGSWQLFGCPSSGPSSMIYGDSIRYVWMSGKDGYARVYMGTMHKTTKQVGYTGVVHVDPNNDSQNFPVIAGEGDNFMIAWEHTSAGDKNVQFVTSTSGTTGISAPQFAHTNLSGNQTNPDMIYAGGKFHLIWSNGLNGTISYRTAEAPAVELSVKVYLQGPYAGGLMNDNLRSLAQFPLVEPYTALGFSHAGEGGGESISSAVLNTSGNDAIVDWVVIELRDKLNSSTVVNTRSALLQRDGDVVDLDGISPLRMAVADDSYFVSIRHRNHMPAMLSSTVALSSSTTNSIDFTASSASTYGSDAQVDVGGVMALWAGNVIADNVIKYTGASNDRDAILVLIGGSVPTNTSIGYGNEDVNMDGIVKYTGASNDRDVVLVNIGGSVPTNTRLAQLP